MMVDHYHRRPRWLLAICALSMGLAVLGLSGCQGEQAEAPTANLVAAVDMPTTEIPAPSPTQPPPTIPPAPKGQLTIDPVSASIRQIDSDAPHPMLDGLRLWIADGTRLDASGVLTTTILERQGQEIVRAEWVVSTKSPGDARFAVVAERVSEGTLSVAISITERSEWSALGVCLPSEQGEHFYGLGQRFSTLNLAGQVLRNRTEETPGLHTTYAPTTFLLSSHGYGLYLDTMASATFDLRTAESGCYEIRAYDTKLHIYFLAGPEPKTVIRRHAELVGLPPLPPEWAFGVWKNLIGGQERVLADLQTLRDAGVPLDAVWIYDAMIPRAGFGWPWQIYGPIAPGEYPDLPGLCDRLHGDGLKVLGYLNPFIYPDWAGYAEARDSGYLVRATDGSVYLQEWTFGRHAYVDFTSPEATAWWQHRVGYALGEVGLDGAMLDMGEEAPRDALYAGDISGYYMDNRYSVLYHRAAFEAGQTAKPGDFDFFARAGYNGSQPYTTGRFTGDQARSWSGNRGLNSVLPAVLNGSLSGWPYWGPDIAGFNRDSSSPTGTAEKELWMRWLQLGALMPTMRDMYGSSSGDPVDAFTDEETLAAFRRYAELHTALKPYLHRHAQMAHEQGIPIVRPLFLDYPDDAETYDLEDQYLLGNDLLVAPVLQPGQAECSVYLPEGRWRYYWTEDVHEGPGSVTVPCPVAHIPLFIRAGAQVELPSPTESD